MKLLTTLCIAVCMGSASAADISEYLRIKPQPGMSITPRYCSDMWSAHESNPSGFDRSPISSNWKFEKEKNSKSTKLRLPFKGLEIFNYGAPIADVEVSYFDNLVPSNKNEISPAQVHVKFKPDTTYRNIPVSDYYYMITGYLSYSYFVSPFSVKDVTDILQAAYNENPDNSHMFPPNMGSVLISNTTKNKQTMFGCFSRVNTSTQAIASMAAYGFDFNMFALRVAEYKPFNPETARHVWTSLKFKDVHGEALRYIESKSKQQ